MKLAIDILNKHIETFNQFDLVCNNGHSLKEETKCVALFSAITTLETMLFYKQDRKTDVIIKSIEYLKGSKYYSSSNESNY